MSTPARKRVMAVGYLFLLNTAATPKTAVATRAMMGPVGMLA